MSKSLAIASGLSTVLVVTLINVSCARQDSREPSSAQIDQIFAQWNKPDSAGCTVGIGRDGKIVYERGYGMASLELGVPLSPESALAAASISKQFTAMSVMLLVRRGQISLDDPVSKYLPELPDYGSPLTIRHLLNHTSGIRDAFLLLELAPPQDPGGDLNDQLLTLLARQRSLNSKPGAEWMYNNGAYALLAVIVKRVSGQSLGAFADANIFKPLGMISTRFVDDPTVIVPSRASNYQRSDGAWRLVPFSTSRGPIGNSGIWTSVRDLLRWAHNWDDVKVGSTSLLDEMQQPTALAGGGSMNWGMGFEMGDYRGAKVVGHGGNDRGIDNYLAWYPQQRLAIAVLCNKDDVSARQLIRSIADLYITEAPSHSAAKSNQPPSALVTLSQEQIRAKVGLYRETNGASLVNFFVQDGQLRGAIGSGTGDSFPLVAVSESRLIIPTSEYSFEFDLSAADHAQRVRGFESKTLHKEFERLPPFTPTSTQLQAYAGTYESSELSITWTIAARDSGLVIRRPARADTNVEPLALDMFSTIGDFMTFTRDSHGNINGFTLVASGVRGLRFERVKQ